MKFSVISLAITLTSALVAANPISPNGLLPRDAACDAKCGQRCGARGVLRARCFASGTIDSCVCGTQGNPSGSTPGVLEVRCEAKGAIDSCVCGTEGNPSGPSRRAA
ncbi:hypothetical protein LZ31DRAFT_599391 [Colletotrichum somersetense]|nr:hypothetical protein LZ31DRAFT_599391 [Colletotrichum somersetense]